MKAKNKGNVKTIIAVVLLVALAAAMSFAYLAFTVKSMSGSKQITIAVVSADKTTTEYTLKTYAEFLRQAMEEADGLTFSGTESEYGMMVDTVNGETASYETNQAYWGFFVNGEYCNYGIDTQPIADGDAFEIVYTK